MLAWKRSLVGLALAALAASGCAAENSRDRFGRTYYVDGAGNWGFGTASVNKGLEQAGYQGAVHVYPWSMTFNPLADQTLRFIAKAKGEGLAKEIMAYQKKYPGAKVNIIALSAGTGVATWACESLEGSATVHNLLLMGSSLSFDYDMRNALEHIDGKVYVYYARSDAILDGAVRLVGTIDGKLQADSAGLVGLKQRSEYRGRVVNIGWSRRYEKYGWTGAHTDCLAEPFVRAVLAKHVVEQPVTTSTVTVAESQT